MKNENRKFRYALNLQTFAGDPPTDPPTDPPVDPKLPEKVVFTPEQQAEVDRIASDRAVRERKKFADYDELKTKLSALEVAEESRRLAALSDTERLQAEKDAATTAAELAKAGASEQLAKANGRVIKSEFKALARELGVRVDALDDAYTLADKTGISVDDEDNVVGIKAAIEALLIAKPFLVEAVVVKPKQIGGPTIIDDKNPQKTKEQLLAEAADKAYKSGRIEDRVAYAELKDELNK